MENYEESKVPLLTPDEIKEIQGSADFLGLNHYSTWLTSGGTFKPNDPESYEKDKNVTLQFWDDGEIGLGAYPKGLYDLLMYINDRYNISKIYITENGIEEAAMMDYGREKYYKVRIKLNGIQYKRRFLFILLV